MLEINKKVKIKLTYHTEENKTLGEVICETPCENNES